MLTTVPIFNFVSDFVCLHKVQSRTQSNACARARMALALGKLTTGTPKFRGSGFVGMHVKPITAQEKFNFPRANAILARAQALLWVRDCIKCESVCHASDPKHASHT